MSDQDSELLVLLEESRALGFLGPGPVAAQINHAERFRPFLTGRTKILDLGSGGGVPGLVLALSFPDAEFLLLDSNLRRCSFLQTAIEQLEVTNRVRILTGRAEEFARQVEFRGTCDAVVARSFGPPAVTAECAIGFMAGPGAVLLISEPPQIEPQQTDSPRWSEAGLNLLGLELGERKSDGLATIQQVTMTVSCGAKYPRRVGIPAKRPIFS